VYTVLGESRAVCLEILPYGNDLASRKTLMPGTRRPTTTDRLLLDLSGSARVKAQNFSGVD
jgi:hypothetical protein